MQFCLPKVMSDDLTLQYIQFDNNLQYGKNEKYKTLTEPLSGTILQPNILIVLPHKRVFGSPVLSDLI